MTDSMSLSHFVALYLVLTLVVGFIGATFIKSAGDFINANRRLPFLLSSMALFALWYGAETVFGASTEFMQHGLLGVIEDPFGGFLCLLLFGLFLVRPLYRQNLLTLGDLFRNKYGPHTETVAAFCIILTFIGYIAAQLIALSLLFATVFGLEPAAGMVLSALIVTAYTTAGGMWAISLTDFVQSILIVAGLLLLCIHLTSQTDFATVMTAPRPGFFNMLPTADSGMSRLDYLAAWLTLGLGSLTSPDIFQRANAARTESIAVRSTLFGAVLYLLFAMLPLYLGLVVLQLEPQLLEAEPQNALLTLAALHAPLWLQVMFYGALISAIFSTCSGALLAPSSILAENLIKPLLLKNSDDKTLLWVSRLSVVIMAAISTGLGLVSGNIYELVAESSIIGAVSILIPMLFALFARKPSATGALLSMLLGLLAYVGFEYGLDESPVPALMLGMAFSLFGMLLGQAITKAQ